MSKTSLARYRPHHSVLFVDHARCSLFQVTQPFRSPSPTSVLLERDVLLEQGVLVLERGVLLERDVLLSEQGVLLERGVILERGMLLNEACY